MGYSQAVGTTERNLGYDMDMYQLNQIPSKAQIQKYLRKIVFGKNLFCPVCRSRKIVKYEERYRCKKCRLKFSLLSHTWLSDMKLPLQQFWLLLWCWTTQIPVRQAISLSKCSDNTIMHWYDRFREYLPYEQDILEHFVQLDEAYFKDRVLVMGKQKGTRKIAYQMHKGNSVDRGKALRFLYESVKPTSSLWTDGASIYKNIDQWWPVIHTRDIHSKFEFSHTSEIEGMFGLLRTFIRRMYHHVTPEKLELYVREFCFRFSSPELFENPQYYLEKTLTLVPTG